MRRARSSAPRRPSPRRGGSGGLPVLIAGMWLGLLLPAACREPEARHWTVDAGAGHTGGGTTGAGGLAGFTAVGTAGTAPAGTAGVGGGGSGGAVATGTAGAGAGGNAGSGAGGNAGAPAGGNAGGAPAGTAGAAAGGRAGGAGGTGGATDAGTAGAPAGGAGGTSGAGTAGTTGVAGTTGAAGRAGTTGTAGSGGGGGTAGTTGNGGGGGLAGTGGRAGSGGTTGTAGSGGSGGAGGAAGAGANSCPLGGTLDCTATGALNLAPDGRVVDFSPAEWNTTTSKWCNARGLDGGISSYAGPSSTAMAVVDTAARNLRFNFMVAPLGWAGGRVNFDSCVDARAFNAVQFTASLAGGSLAGCILQLQIQTQDLRPSTLTNPSGGTCDPASSTCGGYPAAVLAAPTSTPSTYTVLFSAFNNPAGSTIPHASQVVGLQWQVNSGNSGAGMCTGELRVDNVRFVTQ